MNEASTNQKVVRSTPGQELGTGFSREKVRAKPENDLIDYQMV